MNNQKSQTQFPNRLISIIVLLTLIVTTVSLALGVYLGKIYFAPSPDVVALPTPVVSAPTTMPTVDPTASWKTLSFSEYGFICKIPEGWGIVNNMLTGDFVPIDSDKTFNEGFNLIMIKKNSDSQNLIQIDLTRESNPYINKTGSEPEFDRILSTFKFTEKNAAGEFCGGFAGTACPEGYTCKMDGSYPDAGGTCEKR